MRRAEARQRRDEVDAVVAVDRVGERLGLGRVCDEPKPVPQPLHRRTGDEHRALERVDGGSSPSRQAAVASTPSAGAGRVVAGVREHEAARAVRRLHPARREARLPEERRLLVAGDPGHRHASRRRAARGHDPLDETIRGSTDAATPKSASSSSSQSSVSRSTSSVREAFDTSVTCSPVSLQTSQESTVPKARSPAAPRALEQPLELRRGEVRDRGRGRCAARISSAGSSAQRAAVRRSCQTIAGATGRPEIRSQRTVVSRWFAIPIA